MVTLRITVGREGKAVYVLGNGSASGEESAPKPVAPGTLVSRAGVVVVVGVRVVEPPEAQAVVATRARIANRLTSGDLRVLGLCLGASVVYAVWLIASRTYASQALAARSE
jgi:hypothetical protein